MVVGALVSILSIFIHSTNSHSFSFCAGIDSSSNQDQVGKTVAIIVGVLAGLAIVVVLLSFLRRALGKSFKIFLMFQISHFYFHHNMMNIMMQVEKMVEREWDVIMGLIGFLEYYWME